MDRNSVIGIILITLLTIGYFYFFQPPTPEQTPANTETRVSAPTEEESITEETAPEEVVELSPEAADSLRVAALRDKYGDFWTVAEGEEEVITVKTDELTVNINTKGGNIQSAYLNNHTTYDSLPLPIITDNPENEFYFQFAYNSTRRIKSSDFYYAPSEKEISISGEDSATLVMKADLGNGRFVEQVYTFRGNTFDVGYEIHMEGLKEGLNNVSFYTLEWASQIPRTELALRNMRQKSTVVYRLGDDIEKLDATDEPEEEKLTALVKWISFKSQFFSHILISDKDLRSGEVTMRTPENEDINRIMTAKMYVDIPNGDNISNKFLMYMGPNEYTTLASYDMELEETMDLGWWLIGYINKGTTYLFKFLERYISNYGIIIIILGLFIRSLLLPLSFRSYVSMAKVRVLNATPEMKALDEKHKDDPQKLQMAKMGIYREMGASMFGGCLPMLLSYPFLIALFFFFPQAVELRHESFLWATDLSTYDSILKLPFEIPLYGDHVSLFTLLMAASTLVYVYYQQQSQPMTGANSQFRYIAYITPIFLLFFLNSYASGLSLYYLTSNLLQISQTILIKRFFVNDEKLLAEMREKQRQAKKAKKAGKGGKGGGKGGNKNAPPAPQGRLGRWLEKQQKKQEEMMKQRKQSSAPNRQSRRKNK